MAGLDDLRPALLALNPTGPTGFEGLLAAVLEQIAGQPFRLARSGLQAGRDGDTLGTASHLSFECKLYSGALASSDVQSKITQLIGSVNPPDVWVLAATVEAGGQLTGGLQAVASRVGLGILILDWPATSAFPPLAVALAMAAEIATDFLSANIDDSVLVERATDAMNALRIETDFEIHSQAIRSEVCASSLGMANAQAANRRWLSEVFADRAKARAAFGQALAPAASGALPLRPREALAIQAKAHLLSAPSRSVLAIVGGEGHGKSWLAAEAWMELDSQPLMLVVPAADMNPATAYGQFVPFLITQVIRQTSEHDDDRSRRRWERRIGLWAEGAVPQQPRFVLWVDGLNEQPTFEWRRWLDDAATNIERLGGALLVTVRQGFFNERLRRSLNTPISVVTVPEWTLAELDEQLQSQGVDSRQVAPNVRERLRNPRILGIAARLLSSEQIQSFTELSVERLLFEHVRHSDTDITTSEPQHVFERRLAEHAREIIDRVNSQQHDDRLVFDQFAPSGQHVLTSERLAVTAEHFFHALPGEPTLYTLPDDALGLALGLAILQTLRTAERNGRHVEEALNELLEPIAALDKTADAVFSALLVASVDERISMELRAALFVGFVGLQNIDSGYYDPFVGVVRASTEAALLATEQLLADDRSLQNEAWLTQALREVRQTPESLRVIEQFARRWLRLYSLEPSLAVFTSIRDEGQEKYAAKVSEQTEKLTARIAGLPVSEKAFMAEELIRNDAADPARFHRVAIELLAGIPIAPFAREMVACAFSTALHSSIHDAYDVLVSLIRFNRVDWPEARDALLGDAERLCATDASSTSKWAAVQLLRGLSREEDGWRAHQLIEELTVDREKFGAWRRVENYSAVDPCDPSSAEPENLEAAAQDYAAMDVAALTKSRSMGMEDHVFKDARPAMARFRPKVALDKIREYTVSALGRDAGLRRLAVCSLEPHGAALDEGVIQPLLLMASEVGEPRDGESRESRDAWITAQYAIQIGFPHLTGDQQLEFIMALPSPGSPLIKFADVVKPSTTDKLAAALEQALETDDHCRALSALSFARHSGTSLDENSRAAVRSFLSNNHSSVRALALDVIAHADDVELLRAFSGSDWMLSRLDPREESFERWYGSLAWIEAAHHGLRPLAGILDGVVPELFGYAAERLGAEVQKDVGMRIHAAFARALEIEISYTPPLVTQRLSGSGKPTFGFFDVVEPKEEENGFELLVKRMNETDEEFDARHKSYWESFRDFEKSITQQDARLIIEDVGKEAIKALISTAPEVAQSLGQQLTSLGRNKAYRLANFALRLAQGLSKTQPTLAKALFERFAAETGVVTYTTGAASLSLAALTIWQSADSPELDSIRTDRLDTARTDHELAQDVLAALWANKASFLEQYARGKLQSPVPAENARGIMVLGFGLETPLATEVLSRSDAPEGLLGKARSGARYAYERNTWSGAWYAEMCTAKSPEEFWRNSVLFLKIVDGRFEVGGELAPPDGSVAGSYMPGIGDEIRRRANAWKGHRDKTLFGDKVPGPAFLERLS